MKTKNTLFTLLCILLCACEGETIDPEEGGRPLQFQAGIEEMKTRATDTSWEKDDIIGIYMVKAGQALNASALRHNVAYTTTGTTTFKPKKEAEEIILPFDGSNVDFFCYYPFKENITNFAYPVDVSTQSLQSAIDLMYSNNAKNINSKNPNVQTQFYHQLSKIILNIGKDATVDLSDLTVILSNAGTHASFDLASGSLSAVSQLGNIQLKTSDNGSSAEAILIPENDLSKMSLWFILGDELEKYVVALSEVGEITSFEKSTKYTYNVNLFSEKTTGAVESDIHNWTDGPIVNVKANPTNETPPIVKGSKKSPYTVTEAQGKAGTTGAWVEGYIVGSFANSISNFFPGNTGTASSNIAIADSKDETDTGKMIPVNLSEASTSIRNALNIPANEGNVNKKIKVKGNLSTYFSVTGVRNPTDYSFVE